MGMNTNGKDNRKDIAPQPFAICQHKTLGVEV